MTRQHILICISLIFVSLSIFLYRVFGLETWAYLDLDGSPIFQNQSEYLSILNFFSFHQSSYFGVDALQVVAPKILQILMMSNLPQYVYFLLYFITTFTFSYLLLRLFFKRESALIGGLLFTFNPVSVFYLQYSAFIFSYPAIVIILYGTIRYFSVEKLGIKYILLIALGFNFLLSYPRVAMIYLLILGLLGIFFLTNIKKNIFSKKTIIIGIVVFLLNLSTIYGYFSTYIHKDSINNAGINNYILDTKASVGADTYSWLSKESIYSGIFPQEIYKNFGYGYGDIGVILYIKSLLLALFFALFFYFLIRNDKTSKLRNILLLGLLFLLFSIFLRKAGVFFSQETYLMLTYKIFPFMANTVNWYLLIFIPFGILMIVIIFEEMRKLWLKIVYFIGCFGYILLSFLPFYYEDNKKVQTLTSNDFPQIYQQYLYSGDITQQPSILFPLQTLSSTLYFDWSKYPLNINNNTKFKPLFSDNMRLTGVAQRQLYDQIRNNMSITLLQNYRIFNLKNIILFKDATNASYNFDWFEKKDYQAESRNYHKMISSSTGYLDIVKDSRISHFIDANSPKYDFFIYSPRSIIYSSIEELSEGKLLDIQKAPLLMYTGATMSIDTTNSASSGTQISPSVDIFYKKSPLHSMIIPMKIDIKNIDSNFIIQLNQTFSNQWKLVWIDKETFDSFQCVGEIQRFEYSNNSKCTSNISPTKLMKSNYFLSGNKVSEPNHFIGNFIGNSWKIKYSEIPESIKNNKEIYIMIIYEKQIWYNWSLLISGITFIILVLLLIVELSLSYRQKKYDK